MLNVMAAVCSFKMSLTISEEGPNYDYNTRFKCYFCTFKTGEIPKNSVVADDFPANSTAKSPPS